MIDYTDTILKHATDNSRVGILDNADGTGEVGLSRQDIGSRLAIRFTLCVSEEAVDSVRYQVFGCGFTIAACAAAAEMAEGLPIAALNTINAQAINNRLEGLPQERDYCASLAAEALQAAARSTKEERRTIRHDQQTTEDEHGPLLSPHDPLLRQMLASPNPNKGPEEDRQLFAALLLIAAREPCPVYDALGLPREELASLLSHFFPRFDVSRLEEESPSSEQAALDINADVLKLLLSHLPPHRSPVSLWLAHAIAARSAQPEHLWIAMGFFERPQLTAAIQRHLPSLAKANARGMRWKRYLFKQVCEMNGGTMCKAPNCGVCSDYPLCFAPSD